MLIVLGAVGPPSRAPFGRRWRDGASATLDPEHHYATNVVAHVDLTRLVLPGMIAGTATS